MIKIKKVSRQHIIDKAGFLRCVPLDNLGPGMQVPEITTWSFRLSDGYHPYRALHSHDSLDKDGRAWGWIHSEEKDCVLVLDTTPQGKLEINGCYIDGENNPCGPNVFYTYDVDHCDVGCQAFLYPVIQIVEERDTERFKKLRASGMLFTSMKLAGEHFDTHSKNLIDVHPWFKAGIDMNLGSLTG